MEWTESKFSFGLFDFFMATETEYAKYPHAQWVPVDAAPLRPDLLAKLQRGARWVVAMSRFGEQVLKDAGFRPLYVPHGVDSKVYRPIDRKVARERMQKRMDGNEPETPVELGDKFVVLMNAANMSVPSRKGFYEGLTAFKAFHDLRPDSLLYLHTQMANPRGENIFEHMKALKIDPAWVIYPNQYFLDSGLLDAERMNDTYNMADVLLHPSYAEGFGIPIIEAQMAGLPVIVTDCSSMTELCFNGIKVSGTKFSMHPGLYWTRPHIEMLTQALEDVYQDRARHNRMAESYRDSVLHYDIDRVFTNYMLPAIERIREDVSRSAPVLVPALPLTGHIHHWAEMGLYLNGVLHIPCMNGNCAAARVDGGKVIEGAFPSKVGDIELDIEDDLRAGVSKIVMKELTTTYQLDTVQLEPGDVILDIGAHVGIVSIYLAKKYPGIRVYAFEPHPDNYKRLVRNIEANGLYDAIVPINGAVTSDGRDVAMPPLMGNSGGSNIYNHSGTQVSSYTLKEFLYRLNLQGKVKLLKMDCEGAEYEILEGNPDLLKGVEYFVGEFHVNREFNQERMIALQVAVKSEVQHVYIGVSPMSEVDRVAA
jgi:FkbM family methyltransferase